MNGITILLLLVGAVVVYELVLKPTPVATASGNFTLGASVTGGANGVIV